MVGLLPSHSASSNLAKPLMIATKRVQTRELKILRSQSHKWTVYVRGATNEDLGAVIKHVVFQLHPSFNNPTRIVEAPPFELSECGWGEFEIGISIFFHSDVCDKHLDLYHMLKLYPEDESGPQSTKKPVVMESYNEIVFQILLSVSLLVCKSSSCCCAADACWV
ncbi:hypothetical protein ERO13_D11G045100v2 [Gossypium hirsutum]|nr:hypothetical protein ERO13_D11G045100v2 [Gossypium hirsutum]